MCVISSAKSLPASRAIADPVTKPDAYLAKPHLQNPEAPAATKSAPEEKYFIVNSNIQHIYTLAKSNVPPQSERTRRESTSSGNTMKAATGAVKDGQSRVTKQETPFLTNELLSIDPIPDGESLRAKITLQRQREEQGHFIIGYTGNLDDVRGQQECMDGQYDLDDDDDDSGARKVPAHHLRRGDHKVHCRASAR
ncbi:hypothetical protein MRB53_038134 [Persea americana]|nr:hypothetical protein MRB53_038134 [Persea americana]